MKLKLCFYELMFVAVILAGCKKTQPENYSLDIQLPGWHLENSNQESCLPGNIETLSITKDEGEMGIWKVGYWHNQILKEYLLSTPPSSLCNCDRVSNTSIALNNLAVSYGIDALNCLDTAGAYNCLELEPFAFSCASEVIEISRQKIVELQSQTDSIKFFSSAEKALIIETLDFALNGFNNISEKYDLIESWNNLDGKFLDGIVSGGIISILLYSDCFWENSTIEFQPNSNSINLRFLPGLAVVDVAGGYLSFLKSVVVGNISGENADPEAGLRYLKRAGMDALRTSAGPFGVLF